MKFILWWERVLGAYATLIRKTGFPVAKLREIRSSQEIGIVGLQTPLTKPKPITDPEVWMQQIALHMTANQVSFKQAVGELKIPWTTQECEAISARKEFKQILRAEKYKYHTEVANQPGRNKNSAIGMLMVALENLALKGDDEKVIVGIEKLGRLEGWLGPESNIQVFAGLTAKDIEIQKKLILKEIEDTKLGKPTDTNN